MKMSRKEFLAAVGGLTVVGLLAPSCGPDENGNGDGGTDGGNTDAGAGNCLDNGTSTSMTNDHHDDVVISAADIEAGVEKTYTLSGAPHTHTLVVTASHFASLAANEGPLSITSSNDFGHTHIVTVRCA